MSLAELKQESSIEEVAQEQNHYVSHLAEVNKSNDVISTEDIRNEKGVLLVRKGARISQNVAERILNHKLIILIIPPHYLKNSGIIKTKTKNSTLKFSISKTGILF